MMKTIFDVINPNNTISLNRPLAAVLGINAAVIYGALLSKFSYYSEHDMLDNGWFYSTIDDLEESTLLTGRQQTTAINKLVKAGIIKCKRRGLPAKRYFYVNNDVELLEEIVDKGEQALKEIKPTAYIAPKAAGNYAEYSEYKQTAEESDIVYYNEYNETNSEMSNKNQHNRNSCCDKNATHTYNNLKGINPKGNQSINPRKARDAIDTIDISNRERYSAYIKQKLEYNTIVENKPLEKGDYDEILAIMLDVICSKKPYIRVNGENMPKDVVKSAFLKLDESHIGYVLDSMKQNTTKVRNIRSYLITALYNSLHTINNYYRSWVNYDMYGAKA